MAKDSSNLQRRNQARDLALQTLCVKEHYALGFQDNHRESLPLLDVVQALERIIEEIQLARTYTPLWRFECRPSRDTSSSHDGCRPMPGSSMREILTFEVVSSAEWDVPDAGRLVPNAFIDISGYLPENLETLARLWLRNAP